MVPKKAELARRRKKESLSFSLFLSVIKYIDNVSFSCFFQQVCSILIFDVYVLECISTERLKDLGKLK